MTRKEGKGREQKRPTVGRRCDLLWVVETTYSRFFGRPTVGRFWGVQKGEVSLGRKGGCRKTRRMEPDERGKSIDSHQVGGDASTGGVKNFSPFVSV